MLPVVALTTIFIAMPVKTFAFFTMNRQGWLTRHTDQMGADAQSALSVADGMSLG